MKILLVEAQLKKFSRNADSSVNYNFKSAKEISNEDFALTDQYFQQNGYLAFKIDEINIDDIPDVSPEVRGQISDSQYLRNCLFSKFMNAGGKKEDFTPFYHREMQKFAQSVNDSNEG